jgi:hypothetical protein
MEPNETFLRFPPNKWSAKEEMTEVAVSVTEPPVVCQHNVYEEDLTYKKAEPNPVGMHSRAEAYPAGGWKDGRVCQHDLAGA